jgi:hypothetical protein
MRKKLVSFVAARFPAEHGLEPGWIDHQDHQTGLTKAITIGYAQDLLGFGAVDKTFFHQRICGVCTGRLRG